MTGLPPGRVHAAGLHHPAHPARPRYPTDALDALGCPHCGSGLTQGDGLFECPNAHVFDIARQGYVALLGARARTDTGDSADMVAARVQFLGAGHYAAIAAAAAASVAGQGGPILEIGAGTGYYLAAALDRTGASGIALDSSKYAARRAATDHRAISVVADAWSALPIRDSSVGSVLSVFAPRNPDEIVRVLRPGGGFVGVTPHAHHLHELRERLTMLTVDEGKASRLADAFIGRLDLLDERSVEFAMELRPDDVAALVRMGPSARHLTPAQLADQIAALPAQLTVTAAVTVSSFQLVSEPGGRDVLRPG